MMWCRQGGVTAVDALIVGDTVPSPLQGRSVLERLGLTAVPEVFLFTLDAGLPGGTPRPGQSLITFDPAQLDHLDLGIPVAVLASNHINDFNDEGVAATIEALEARSIRHVGAGASLEEAMRPKYLDLRKGRLAVLAFAETSPRVGAIAATSSSAGAAPLEEEPCISTIAEARREADWVWVVLHWGTEYVRHPDPDQRRLAKRFIQAGADLVVGSHTHVAMGFERFGGGRAFYGLGNFMFPDFLEARGFVMRYPPVARRGLAILGKLEKGSWVFEPRLLRLDANGLPQRSYGRVSEISADLESYEARYQSRRRRERINYLVQRALFMTPSERRFWMKRLRGLLP